MYSRSGPRSTAVGAIPVRGAASKTGWQPRVHFSKQLSHLLFADLVWIQVHAFLLAQLLAELLYVSALLHVHSNLMHIFLGLCEELVNDCECRRLVLDAELDWVGRLNSSLIRWHLVHLPTLGLPNVGHLIV